MPTSPKTPKPQKPQNPNTEMIKFKIRLKMLTKIASAFASVVYAQFLDDQPLQLDTATSELQVHNTVEIPSNAAKLLCYIIKNGTIFDYTPLTAPDHYSVESADKS